MNSLAMTNRVGTNLRKEAETLRRKRKWWAIALTGTGAVVCVVGLASVLFASLSLLHVNLAGGNISVVSTVLIACTFLLLILAAHCLDKIDQANAAIREADFRE